MYLPELLFDAPPLKLLSKMISKFIIGLFFRRPPDYVEQSDLRLGFRIDISNKPDQSGFSLPSKLRQLQSNLESTKNT